MIFEHMDIPEYLCIPDVFLLFNLNLSERQYSSKTKLIFAKGTLLTFTLVAEVVISVPQESVAVLRRIACAQKQHRWFESFKKKTMTFTSPF